MDVSFSLSRDLWAAFYERNASWEAPHEHDLCDRRITLLTEFLRSCRLFEAISLSYFDFYLDDLGGGGGGGPPHAAR